MFDRIMFATLFVSDQERALDFYTTHFGFEKLADNHTPEGRFLVIGYKGQGWPVLLWTGKGGRPEAEDDIMGTIFLGTENLRKDFAELKQRGIGFVEPEPVDYAYGVRVTALDPDGNRIALREQARPQQLGT